MRVGVVVPQGWIGEYQGWDPAKAWTRTVEVGRHAETLGFESIWLFDHFHPAGPPDEQIVFESFTSLAALGAITKRVGLGHLVLSAGYRNPALTAKMIATMDVQTDGRMELGIGAGWKQDEWTAFGYGFPAVRDRMKNLRDQLEVLSRMLSTPRSTYAGEHASVLDAVNLPQPVQKPRVPIVVGGNGRNVTWRLAARYGDELNVSGLSPDELADGLPVIASRCEEIGRDPTTLRLSVHMWPDHAAEAGEARVDWIGRYAAAGASLLLFVVAALVASA